MSILFYDGFDDDMTLSLLAERYTILASSIPTIAGRFGDRAFGSDDSLVRTITKTGLTPSGTLGSIGVAVRFINVNDQQIVIRNGAASVASIRLLPITGGAKIQVNDVAGPIFEQEGFENGQWYYIEFSWDAVTGGSWTLCVNEQELSTGTGNFLSSNGVGWDSLHLQAWSSLSSGLSAFDDLYMTDGASLGELAVHTVRPTTDGTFTQWDTVGSAFHSPNLSDPDSNEGTNVNTSVLGERDTYFVPTPENVQGDILAVEVVVRAQNDQGSATDLGIGIYDGIDIAGNELEYLANEVSYSRKSYTWTVNPQTLLPWKRSEIILGEFGLVLGGINSIAYLVQVKTAAGLDGVIALDGNGISVVDGYIQNNGDEITILDADGNGGTIELIEA